MTMEEYTKSLQEIVDIQIMDGNWNDSPYMHGMTNGLLFALAMAEGTTPEFLKAPKEYLCDKKA